MTVDPSQSNEQLQQTPELPVVEETDQENWESGSNDKDASNGKNYEDEAMDATSMFIALQRLGGIQGLAPPKTR